ncbi:MAG: MFS transporter, partial [Anaerolineae bacterium]
MTSPFVAQKTTRHWVVAAGAFLAMVGASVLLSGLSLLTTYIVTDLYVQKDAAGQVVTTLVNGTQVPVPANGGAAAFLVYYTIMLVSIVVPLLFFSGKLYAKYGAEKMLAVGGLVMSLGLVLFGLASGSIMFYLGGLMIGVGYGVSLAVIPPALVNAWFVKNKGLVLGVVLAATGLGGLIWSYITPMLAVSDLGWRGVAFIFAGVLLICTLVPSLFMVKTSPSEVDLIPYGADPEQLVATRQAGGRLLPGFTYSQALRSKWFWVACGAFFLLGAAVAVTQVLSITFKTAAYPNPIDKSTWT